MCELCSRAARLAPLCDLCWEMIGRVQAAQERIMFGAIQRTLKTLVKKA